MAVLNCDYFLYLFFSLAGEQTCISLAVITSPVFFTAVNKVMEWNGEVGVVLSCILNVDN